MHIYCNMILVQIFLSNISEICEEILIIFYDHWIVDFKILSHRNYYERTFVFESSIVISVQYLIKLIITTYDLAYYEKVFDYRVISYTSFITTIFFQSFICDIDNENQTCDTNNIRCEDNLCL